MHHTHGEKSSRVATEEYKGLPDVATSPLQRERAKSGQSLIETCIAVGLICLIFMGLFQVSQIFAAREILYHAAARGARAKTVGFNWWMVRKSVNVAAIPNCGKMLQPDIEIVDLTLHEMAQRRPGEFWDWSLEQTPASKRFSIEIARIPEYLYSPNQTRANYILDYEGWKSDSIRVSVAGFTPDNGIGMLISDNPDTMSGILHFTARQTYPLWVPMHRTFYAADSVELSGESSIENHYPLYLESYGAEE